MSECILGIDTSCDDTAAGVVSSTMEVHSSVIASQIDQHAPFGGVVPEVASRAHLEQIGSVIERALSAAHISTPSQLHAVAVTRGPGLAGALIVGVSAAKALALAYGLPIVGVNHLEGHLYSAALGDVPFSYPGVVLLVSGGHTLLAEVPAPGSYRMIGATRDDSVGEAYDKVARLLGLGYPGGPVIDRLAGQGSDCLGFPRPMIDDGLDLSFSGLKTAVVQRVRKEPDLPVEDIAASFAAAVMDVLVRKSELAIRAVRPVSFAVVGGVAASPILRERMKAECDRLGVPLSIPPLAYATDNGAMIAAAAWPRLQHLGPDGLDFAIDPGLDLTGPDVAASVRVQQV
jgi:N6-L-threonylcarbamoyladenine synthase